MDRDCGGAGWEGRVGAGPAAGRGAAEGRGGGRIPSSPPLPAPQPLSSPGPPPHRAAPEDGAMNGSLSVGGCGPREDPARFVLVPAAYAAALGLGLPANLAALAVFGRGERPARALRVYLLNLALADVLFTLTLPFWLTYYLGLPPPDDPRRPAHPEPGPAQPQQLPGPHRLLLLRAPLSAGLLAAGLRGAARRRGCLLTAPRPAPPPSPAGGPWPGGTEPGPAGPTEVTGARPGSAARPLRGRGRGHLTCLSGPRFPRLPNGGLGPTRFARMRPGAQCGARP
uniref:G-protein coupled receptors family 1 profile domain-containing protein n=1 Tax=Ornithorhynchus anatinus TaxID=9258 RepID=A0A6I8MY34_ORNAN